jgi:hypothetical protein
MKQILIAGLLAAIGAVVLTNGAQAESRYCYNNPDDSRCDYDPDFSPRLRPPPPPPGSEGDFDESDVPGYGRPRPRPPQLGDYEVPRPPGEWGQESRRRYCWRVGQSLREYGYRGVRPVECGGNNFKYTAYRGYQRYVIKVKARTGRIMYELPN